MRSLFFLILCLLLVHCSEPQTEYIRILDEIPEHIQEVENLTIFPGDSEPRYSIDLIPVQTFGEEGEPYLTDIVRAFVDDNNRVIAWTYNRNKVAFPPYNELYVYNEDGTFHTEIGGRGRGPGEFMSLGYFYPGAGKVYVFDSSEKRLNVFNGDDYSFERATLIEQWSVRNHEAVQDLGLSGYYTRNDGNHLAVFGVWRPVDEAPDHVLLLMDTDGNVLNAEPMKFPAGFTISPETTPPSPSMTLPFMGKTVVALSPDDALYSAWTQDFLIKKYDANGVYESAIYYPVKGSPFNLNDHTESSRYNRRDITNAFENSEKELPDSNPILDELVVDDENRIWAAVPMDPHRENYEWWILAPSGELLAKLQRPRLKPIFDIKNGYLYGKEIDDETGAEFIVKYRIEFKERNF